MISGHWLNLMLDDDRPRHPKGVENRRDCEDPRTPNWRPQIDEGRYREVSDGRTAPHNLHIDIRDY